MDDFSFTHLAKPNTGDYYEGSANFMRAIYPRPFVTPATVPDAGHRAIVFREDFYDPATRIRRGRFYESVGSLDVAGQNVRFEPYIRFFADRMVGGGSIAHFQFAAAQTAELAVILGRARGYDIAIGRDPALTSWKIIEGEGLADGGILYTLRSRSSFGLLPALKDDAGRVVAEAYQNVVEAGLRFDPTAIVDTCRESCVRVLGSHFKMTGKDLGDIAREIENCSNQHNALVNAARIIARLHSRTKSSEHGRQAAKGNLIREISEDDGLLAIRLLGLVLQDLGYGRA